MAESWTLISTSPEEFKGGGIWDVILNIHDAVKAIGYALLVLFFVAGVVKTCGSAVRTGTGCSNLRLGIDDGAV